MKFSITGDIDSNTGLGLKKIWNNFNQLTSFFENRNYGVSVSGISLCIVCVNPEFHQFKQRKRFDKRAKIIYHDILLDYYEILNNDIDQKIEIINLKLIHFIDEWHKYKFDSFDILSFKKDVVHAIRR
jgi:hypothetical protein